jgi:hypothetical protein
MIEPGTERVRLEPTSLELPRDVRIVQSRDRTAELRVTRSWRFILFLFSFIVCLTFVVLFDVGQSPPALVFTASIIATTLLAFAALYYWDGGGGLTRVWRFGPGRVSREGHLPLPARLFPRDFPDVDEFEIVHALFTSGLFRRDLQGGHQDTLRFRAGDSNRPVTLMERALSPSSATLRGGLFTQDHAGEIEREILPEVLAVAFLAAGNVGVPLYVIEKTSYIGTDSDG